MRHNGAERLESRDDEAEKEEEMEHYSSITVDQCYALLLVVRIHPQMISKRQDGQKKIQRKK